MRSLLALLVLALLGGIAQAQKQEKFTERLLKVPDQTLVYDLRKSSFGSNLKFSSKDAYVKSFAVDSHFATQAFVAKSYGGAQPAWMGNFKFATKDAPAKNYDGPDSQRKPELKAVAVNESQFASKTMDTKASDEGSKGFFKRGRSQDRIDSLQKKGLSPDEIRQKVSGPAYAGDLRPMTIDEIRTLLNKNK